MVALRPFHDTAEQAYLVVKARHQVSTRHHGLKPQYQAGFAAIQKGAHLAGGYQLSQCHLRLRSHHGESANHEHNGARYCQLTMFVHLHFLR